MFEDLRIIDMYESAIRADVPELDERTGNWVQKYQTPEDILLFASAQFSRYAEVKAFIEGSIRDRAAIVARRDEVAAQTPAARSTQPNDKTGGDAK